MLFPTRSGGVDCDINKPVIMGVLNVTPDSFSDAGQYFSGTADRLAAAFKRARQMVDEGATFIDIGGESTRPGASPVSVQQELDRVMPVIEHVAANLDCIISVDTSSPEVMFEAARAGAGLLNDVRGFRRKGAESAAAASKLPLCIMHMQGEPDFMQQNPSYEQVENDVASFLQGRVDSLLAAGVDADQIILDPGFGFGKNLQHNLVLLKNLERLKTLGFPLLVGVSRKSMIGQVLGRPVDQRLYGGLALAVIAAIKGASIIRTHDVLATHDALAMAQAVLAS